jgi:hypothetical protein
MRKKDDIVWQNLLRLTLRGLQFLRFSTFSFSQIDGHLMKFGTSESKSRFLTQKNSNRKITNSNLPKTLKNFNCKIFLQLSFKNFNRWTEIKLRQSFGDKIYEFCLPD